MRIVSGKLKGRIFSPPGNLRARPTTDFAKESLFNVISNEFEFEGLEVLDLFAGTGSISFEFASRGAERIDSIELNHNHVQFINKTINQLGISSVRVIKCNAFVFLRSCKNQYDIVFADPPYELEGVDTIPDLVFEKNILKANGWFILEHSSGHSFSEHANFYQHRHYGNVHFSFFRK
jgi:16S rRNA (guanine(966)-N(2))-methyltransferase RsmD